MPAFTEHCYVHTSRKTSTMHTKHPIAKRTPIGHTFVAYLYSSTHANRRDYVHFGRSPEHVLVVISRLSSEGAWLNTGENFIIALRCKSLLNKLLPLLVGGFSAFVQCFSKLRSIMCGRRFCSGGGSLDRSNAYALFCSVDPLAYRVHPAHLR